MVLNFPESEKEILNRIIADIQNELPRAGPFLRNNLTYALAAAYAGRCYDNYELLKEILKQMFPDTATGEYLERWGGYRKENRLPATKSSGLITVTGVLDSNVPIGTQFQTSDNNIYEVQSPATIAKNVLNITTLSRNGSTVTATTTNDHFLASGVIVNIAGATELEYNGEFEIIVTSSNTFIYSITTTPSTPATGSPTATFFGVTVEVDSVDTGADTNLPNGSKLTLVSGLSGIDPFAFVQYSEIDGGTDGESDLNYRSRVLYTWRNPGTEFNVAKIKQTIKKISFVDRIFVNEITPAAGNVTVYFTIFDEDSDNIIPSSEQVNQVKEQLMTVAPAHVDPLDIIVAAPTAVPVDFTFTTLSPNTITMLAAIKEALEILFKEQVNEGENLTEAAYLSAIYQTVDLETGDIVKAFSRSTPLTDVTINAGQLATLGTVTFS